jgi:hypothetical protein
MNAKTSIIICFSSIFTFSKFPKSVGPALCAVPARRRAPALQKPGNYNDGYNPMPQDWRQGRRFPTPLKTTNENKLWAIGGFVKREGAKARGGKGSRLNAER